MANAPVKKYQFGNVVVNVWETTVGKGKDSFTAQSVSVNKSYKDKDGKWQQSTSFKFSEIPFVIMALEKAMEDKYLREDISEVSFEDVGETY